MGLETVRRFPFVDAVVSGEAEAVFPTLVDRILGAEDYDDLQGVYTRNNDDAVDAEHPPNAPRIQDLDALPQPCYDEFFDQWHAADLETDEAPRLLFETSRGCWWGEREHCTFCGLNGTSMAFRSKSAERALDELTELAARYPGHKAMVVDNILDMRYFRDFIPALARERLDIQLFYEVKANLTKDQVRLLADAGIREVQPGIESLSDEVLKLMGKGVRASRTCNCSSGARSSASGRYGSCSGFSRRERRGVPAHGRVGPLARPPAAAGRRQSDPGPPLQPQLRTGPEKGLTGVEPYPAYRHVYPFPTRRSATWPTSSATATRRSRTSTAIPASWPSASLTGGVFRHRRVVLHRAGRAAVALGPAAGRAARADVPLWSGQGLLPGL